MVVVDVAWAVKAVELLVGVVVMVHHPVTRGCPSTQTLQFVSRVGCSCGCLRLASQTENTLLTRSERASVCGTRAFPRTAGRQAHSNHTLASSFELVAQPLYEFENEWEQMPP